MTSLPAPVSPVIKTVASCPNPSVLETAGFPLGARENADRHRTLDKDRRALGPPRPAPRSFFAALPQSGGRRNSAFSSLKPRRAPDLRLSSGIYSVPFRKPIVLL